MIPVARKPKPGKFDEIVRQPGRTFLVENSPRSSKEFKPFWKEIRQDLHEAYDNICSYTCIYLASLSGTVDHFLPKSRFPCLAYEWSNYRLALESVNQYKGSSIGLLDPFEIEEGWFALDFPTCFVVIGSEMPKRLNDKAKNTIKILQLNNNHFTQSRFSVIESFWYRDLDWRTLKKKYPFLAKELERQNLRNRKQIRLCFEF